MGGENSITTTGDYWITTDIAIAKGDLAMVAGENVLFAYHAAVEIATR